MKILFIGDVHGAIQEYLDLLQKAHLKHDESFQVGDLGYKTVYEKWALKSPESAHVLRGNHDYPFQHPRVFLKDFSKEYHGTRLFGIPGARSIDRNLLTPGITYFEDEQLSYAEMLNAVDNYTQYAPHIMISHDCPTEIRSDYFNVHPNGRTLNGDSNKTITDAALQQCFETHQPDIWLFGHHHKKLDVVVNGTRFICLPPLEYFMYEF